MNLLMISGNVKDDTSYVISVIQFVFLLFLNILYCITSGARVCCVRMCECVCICMVCAYMYVCTVCPVSFVH